MALTLGTNIASLRSQRQLIRNDSELSTVFERLSSGQRINRASDDAAGLAVADSLRTDARVYNQGVRNLNDGLSLLNIADASLDNLTGIVTRLEELASQAANGVYGAAQRSALDAEAQALREEFFRISQTTEFNDQKLLTGENGSISLQAGIGNDAILNASVGGAIGTGDIESAILSGSTAGDNDLVTADFNGDGLIDVATTNGTLSGLVIALGNGNGTFSELDTLTSAGKSSGLTTGDFNNDGIVDLASADYGNNVVSVFLGTGNGTFSSATSFAIGDNGLNQVRAFTSADFNGDGNLDLAAANTDDDTVSILLGDGSGSFSSAGSFSSNVETKQSSLETGDFNGDGIIDLVRNVRSADEVIVYFGDGAGSFAAGATLSTGSGPFSVRSGDVNGDGNLDLVAATYSDQEIDVFLGDGSGGFSSRITSNIGLAVGEIELGDFNGDGLLDVGATQYIGSSLQILLGGGNGQFSLSSSNSGAASALAPLELADVDGDGVLDAISVGSGNVKTSLGETTDGVAPLLPFSLETVADAKQALSVFQNRRELLTAQRGEIGAIQSRIQVASNVLSVTSEVYQTAESRIRDADIASETANLTRLQILRQATAAVLSQANQQPALALELLGGG